MKKPGTITKMKAKENDIQKDKKVCPVLAAGSDQYSFNCMKSECEWWEKWYEGPPVDDWIEGCAVKAIFEMLRRKG